MNFIHNWFASYAPSGSVALGMGPNPYTLPSAVLGTFFAVTLLIIIWSLVWKSVALWHAARSNQKVWFVVLILVNTLGILEIIYIFFLRKDKAGLVTSAPVAPAPVTPGAPVTPVAPAPPTIPPASL
jgi:hypothetical protein